MNDATTLWTEKSQPDLLTETLQSKLAYPERSSDFDLHGAVNQVLNDVGLSTSDTGGELTFYGSDPILQSPLRFGTMAAIGLAARSVAVAALWRQATGEGQDISVDVRRRCGVSADSLMANGKPSMVDRPPRVVTRLAHS